MGAYQIRSTARYIFFVNTVVMHKPPFVMIAAEPYGINILKRLVFENFLFGQMAAIVEKRHVLSIIFV